MLDANETTRTAAAAAGLDVQALRTRLVRLSRRHSRRAHEAEDLAHDIIVSALRRGLDLDDDGFVRSLAGAARRHAAFVARGAGRRQAREARVAVDGAVGFELVDVEPHGAPLSTLTPSLRVTALLLLAGLARAEMRAVLGLNDTALRKRLQALRAAAPLQAQRLPRTTRTTVIQRLRKTQTAVLRQLMATSAPTARARCFAVADPDGHGLIFATLTVSGRTATAIEPAVSRAPSKSSKGSHAERQHQRHRDRVHGRRPRPHASLLHTDPGHRL